MAAQWNRKMLLLLVVTAYWVSAIQVGDLITADMTPSESCLEFRIDGPADLLFFKVSPSSDSGAISLRLKTLWSDYIPLFSFVWPSSDALAHEFFTSQVLPLNGSNNEPLWFAEWCGYASVDFQFLRDVPCPPGEREIIDDASYDVESPSPFDPNRMSWLYYRPTNTDPGTYTITISHEGAPAFVSSVLFNPYPGPSSSQVASYNDQLKLRYRPAMPFTCYGIGLQGGTFTVRLTMVAN